MKTRFIVSLFFILLFYMPSMMAQTDNWDIQLGKRKNNIWSRQIQEVNLGNTFTSYQPLFFKTHDDAEWQRVGVLGKNIFPFLPTNDFSLSYFNKYKSKKVRSYWCLGLSTTSIIAWGLSSLDYGLKHRDPSIRAFINPRSLLCLGSYFGFALLGSHWNAKGDLDLFTAIKGDLVEPQKESISWYLGLSGNGGVALALQF